MAELKQSEDINYRDQVIVDGDQDLSLGSEEIERVNAENAPIPAAGSDSESSECATDAFKEAFLETQRKLVDLEEDLKGSRQYLVCLEEACESTEQKITELKNASSQDEHDLSIAEENRGSGRSSKVSLEDYAAVLESLETEREQAEDVRIRAARLENKLEETSSEISRLLSQLDVDKQVDSDAKDVRDNATELRDEITMMKDDCALYCSRIARLTEENEALKKDKSLNDALLQEVKTLKSECDEIESENEQLEQEKQSLREELGALEEKLALLESNQVQRDRNVDEAVNNTQNKLANAESCLEQLKQQVLDHNEQVQELEDNCDQSRARNIELEKELSALHIRIQDLENSLDAEQKEKQELQAEFMKKAENQNKWGAQMDKELRDVGREKEYLRLQLIDCKSKADTEVRNLTKQLNEAQVRCEIFKKEVAEKERELQACRRDTERCNSEFSSLENQLEGANDDNARLQEENKRLEEEIYSLTGQRAEKVDFPQEIKPTSSPPPLAQAESDLSDLEEEVVVPKCDLVVEAAPEQVEGSDSETGEESVEAMLRHALEGKKDLEQKLAEAEQRAEETADELSETIRRLNDRCEELSRELTNKEVGNADGYSDKALELEEELKQLREENQQLQKELEKAQSHRELVANGDIEELEEKYESLKKAYNELLSDSENLQGEHDKVVEEKDVLLEEVEEWQNHFEAGKHKFEKLTSENENLKDEKKKLEKQVQQLQEELTKKGDVYSKEMENQLKSQRAKIAERLKRLKAETESSEDSFDKEEDAVSEWREMYTTLRTRFDQIERTKISIERDRDRLARKCNNVEDELEEVRAKYSRVRREVSDAHGEVSNLRQLLSEHRAAKDSAERQLKKQEEKCEKHLKELDNLTWQLTRENNDGGLVVKFESLKLKFEELEGEKESLEKKANDLQYQVHIAEESSKRMSDLNEMKLNEANEEDERLEQELKQAQIANTEIEVLLEKVTKEKVLEEQQCQWYQNELAKKEAVVNDLEQKLRSLQTTMKFASEKADDKQGEADKLRTRVALLEQEVERLNEEVGAKREQDEVDSGSLRMRVAELETSLEALKADLESKDCELENVEKEKESLSLHTVELKREIQCLYKRFEATQAQVAELQSLPQAVAEIQNEAPLEVVQVNDVQSAPPPEPQKVEKTEMTIDVESKPDVELDVLITNRPRERVAGLERKVSIVNIPVNVPPSGVGNGGTASVTEEPESPIQDSGSLGMLASEPDDEVFPPPPPVETLIPPDEQVEMFSSPPCVEKTTPVPTPERIRVSAQALPQPQVPRSLDTRRFPFLTEGAVRVGSDPYRPVPVQSRMIPDERRRIHDYDSRDGRYFPDMFRPGRHQRTRSEPGDIGKIRDLEGEPLFSPTPEDRRGQDRVPPRPRLPEYYPPVENFESPRVQTRDPYDKPSERDDGQRKGPRTDRPRAEVNPYEVRPREVRGSPIYSAPHSPMLNNRQRPPPPRGKELYPYAKPRSPNSDAEQKTPAPHEYGYQRAVGHRPASHDPRQSRQRGTGTSPQQIRGNQSPRAKRETPDNRYYVRDENAAYPSYERNGHYDSRPVTGGQRIAPDQGYGTIDGQHLLAERLRQDYSNVYLRDSYMYLGGVDL